MEEEEESVFMVNLGVWCVTTKITSFSCRPIYSYEITCYFFIDVANALSWRGRWNHSSSTRDESKIRQVDLIPSVFLQ